MARGKLINLTQAWKMQRMAEDGKSQQYIADAVGCERSVVSKILSGKNRMLEMRSAADGCEALAGGIVIGTGNTRFHAEDSSYEGTEAASIRHQHPTGETWADGQRVLPAPDTLSVLLAEEELLTRLEEAGIDPDEVMIIDHESDVDDGASGKLGKVGAPVTVKRAETWEELLDQVRAKHPGKPEEYILAVALKQCEREGADVDSNDVRDPDFKGWPTTPWTPAKTNREDPLT